MGQREAHVQQHCEKWGGYGRLQLLPQLLAEVPQEVALGEVPWAALGPAGDGETRDASYKPESVLSVNASGWL